MTATARPAMTKRQRKVRDFVRDFRRTHGYCATFREVMDKFGFDSVNGALCHLVALRRKGYVTWENGQSRTLRIVEGRR